jgi:two-component system KDP operon response regulator KdpE
MAAGAPCVLVVDDVEAIRTVCALNLTSEGYRVVEAATPREALEKLASEDVAVVLLDLDLKADRDGLELAREIRRRCPRVAIVLASGTVPLPDWGDLVDGGLVKPFELADLIATVTRLDPL